MNIRKAAAAGLGGMLVVGSGLVAAAALSPATATPAAPVSASDVAIAAAGADLGGAHREKLVAWLMSLPPELRADIVGLAEMEPKERRARILEIRDDIRSGGYGPEVDARVQDLRDAFVEGGLPGLRDEIKSGW